MPHGASADSQLPRREVPSACGSCGSPARRPFYEPGDVVECSDCGVLYVSPRPTADAIAAFYSAAGHYASWDLEPGRAAMWNRRTSRLERLVPAGRLLDIGAGQGDFAATARRSYEVDGTEVSLEGQRLAKERHGLQLILGDAIDLDLPRDHYEVITLWHVLEHVAEPLQLLARCHSLLRPGGVIAVAVPNANEALRIGRARLRAFVVALTRVNLPPAMTFPRLELSDPSEEVHLTHFTLATLTRVIERAGFTIIERGLDDFSAQAGWQARVKHRWHAALGRAGVVDGPAIFVAGRK